MSSSKLVSSKPSYLALSIGTESRALQFFAGSVSSFKHEEQNAAHLMLGTLHSLLAAYGFWDELRPEVE